MQVSNEVHVLAEAHVFDTAQLSLSHALACLGLRRVPIRTPPPTMALVAFCRKSRRVTPGDGEVPELVCEASSSFIFCLFRFERFTAPLS